MNLSENLPFISGEFTPKEAREILTSLIAYKIRFHQEEVFRAKITTGRSLHHSSRRIEELKVLQERALQLIEKALPEGHTIRIKGNIKLEIVANSFN